jgi:folate-dependent phosphoribosylglycinamide formyltransferase PurN
MDTGPIIAQSAVPVLEQDSRNTLAGRILIEEHATLVRVLGWIAEDRLEILEDPAPSTVAAAATATATATATPAPTPARPRVRIRGGGPA